MSSLERGLTLAERERSVVDLHAALVCLEHELAHDLNNLLLTILGRTELARDGVTAGARAESLAQIELAAERATQLAGAWQKLLWWRTPADGAGLVSGTEIVDLVHRLGDARCRSRGVILEARAGAVSLPSEQAIAISIVAWNLLRLGLDLGGPPASQIARIAIKLTVASAPSGEASELRIELQPADSLARLTQVLAGVGARTSRVAETLAQLAKMLQWLDASQSTADGAISILVPRSER